VQLDQFSHELQLHALGFAKKFIRKGVEGEYLLRFEGTIPADHPVQVFESTERQCGDANEVYTW